MSTILPIAITILRHAGRYLFIRRRQPPYEDLWSMVGGKVRAGEHVVHAAIREVLEETGAKEVRNYVYRGIVSERLVDSGGNLLRHFLIFVGCADIDSFSPHSREGELALFTDDEVVAKREDFLPSDWWMFQTMREAGDHCGLYEAELVHTDGTYSLAYYREYEP